MLTDAEAHVRVRATVHAKDIRIFEDVFVAFAIGAAALGTGAYLIFTAGDEEGATAQRAPVDQLVRRPVPILPTQAGWSGRF